MGNSNKARYIDADQLMQAMYSAMPGMCSSYQSDPIAQAIDAKIQVAIQESFQRFINNLRIAIEVSAVPYDKCLLCVQKDSCIPPHPLGDSR